MMSAHLCPVAWGMQYSIQQEVVHQVCGCRRRMTSCLHVDVAAAAAVAIVQKAVSKAPSASATAAAHELQHAQLACWHFTGSLTS